MHLEFVHGNIPTSHQTCVELHKELYIDTLEDIYETHVSSLNDFNDVPIDTIMIEEDAQDQDVVNNERLKEQECLGELYDNIFGSPKNNGDGNLEDDFINELVKTKLYDESGVGKLSNVFLLLNLKAIHGWNNISFITILW